MSIFNTGKQQKVVKETNLNTEVLNEQSPALFQHDPISPEDYELYCQFYGLSPIDLDDLTYMLPLSLRQ